MDAENVLEAKKAEMAMMQEEKICVEEWLTAAEIELEETKREHAKYKDMEKLANDLQDFVLEAGGNDVHDNRQINLDEDTMKALLEEAVRDFAEEMNKAHSRGCRPADGDNGGGGREGGNGGGRPE
ncbi:hypothetical protein QUC31_009861 [Theobroma cacao]|uniref:Uncharacterized protein n=1 Tax=Theobroma cacao TaxID=3641 RepID=A0A061F894_THECC|nr:Uncharacterized protein TCM_025996 [Theobroma cacao]